MSSPARIDVLVYGASGFTGYFIAARIAWHVSAGRLTSYALCGRDASRLAAVASRLASAGLPAPAALLLADARDEAALRAAFCRASLVISAAGPFAPLGLGVASACVAAGSHYLDICGEPLALERTASALSAAARAAAVSAAGASAVT